MPPDILAGRIARSHSRPARARLPSVPNSLAAQIRAAAFLPAARTKEKSRVFLLVWAHFPRIGCTDSEKAAALHPSCENGLHARRAGKSPPCSTPLTLPASAILHLHL